MNQQFLINDDFHFDEDHKAWIFTAIHTGSLLTFVVNESAAFKSISQSTKFDWEAKAEQWCEENELDEESVIYL